MAYVEGEFDLNGNKDHVSYVYPPMYGYGNGGFGNGFGGDWGWIVLLLLLAGNNGWGGFGGFGGFGAGVGLTDGGLLGYAIGNNATKGDLSDGLGSLQLSNQIEGVRDGVTSLSNQLCNSTASVNQALSNGFYSAEISANNRAINQMQDTFALSRQLCECCSDNRLATADLKSTIIQENCQDREVINLALRDVIASNTANTQAILDKLCAQEIDNYRRENENLRTQLNMASLQASQTAQTALLREGQVATMNSLVNELRSCPIPAQPVYGSQPIFTCPNNNSCGCGIN